MKRNLMLMFGIVCACIFMLSGCSNQSATSIVSVKDKIDFGTYNNEIIK